MEAKLPVILHDQLSSVDYSCCRFPQKESKRVLLLLVASQFLGISRMDEQDNRVGFRFLPLFRRFADEFVIEPYIGLAFLDSCLCRP